MKSHETEIWQMRATLVVKGCNDMTSVPVVAFRGSSYEVELNQMWFSGIAIELVFLPGLVETHIR